MATRFELVLRGANEVHLRAAGEEAIREIHRIAARFSFYDPASELSFINREAREHPVGVSGEMFELLSLCQKVHVESEGAFDPSVGPLMKAWGFTSGAGSIPALQLLQKALTETGFGAVQLDSATQEVFYTKNGLKLDLGGIAKGWALDECRTLLADAGITDALLHGGTSTVIGMGLDGNEKPWSIGIEDPYLENEPNNCDGKQPWFATCTLNNSCLSVSAIHGKSFTENEIEFGHVINPTTGQSVTGRLVSSVCATAAALADAWSTALLVSSSKAAPNRAEKHAGISEFATFEKPNSSWLLKRGKWSGF